MKYDTIREATEAWVNTFNAIPQAIVEKLTKDNFEEVREITPPAIGDNVYICEGDFDGQYGEISGHDSDDEGTFYAVDLIGENEGKGIHLRESDFEVQRDDFLPIWGTLWALSEPCDNWWLETKEGLQAMADCGFRIYEQEDWQYIFGIDGAGYNFMSEHFIPLYKARGLHWHKEENK